MDASTAGCADYYSIIQQPSSLRAMWNLLIELKGREHIDLSAAILRIVEGVALIWENCLKFNQPNGSGRVLRDVAFKL